MPRLKPAIQAIRAQLHADLRTATGLPNLSISKGWPRIESNTVPRAVIAVLSSGSSFGGEAAARDLESNLEFGIQLWLPMPDDPEDPGEDSQLDVHDELVQLIEGSPRYASVGHFPHISEVYLGSRVDQEEECLVVEMKVAMTCYLGFGT